MPPYPKSSANIDNARRLLMRVTKVSACWLQLAIAKIDSSEQDVRFKLIERFSKFYC